MQAATRHALAAPAAFGLLLALFSVLFVRNAWVVDDAYITFRTVDNLLAGHGLVWNVGERVQAYSHPLWVFAVSAAAWISGEVFYTSIALSYACCIGSFLVFWRAVAAGGERWRAGLLVGCVLASKAVVDYSSSGLENALSYLLATLFASELFAPLASDDRAAARRVARLFLIGSLSFLNRQDTQLLYLPAVLHALATSPLPRLRLLRIVALASLPGTGWALFSLFYYGSPFPNTAIAKLFGVGVPFGEKLMRGVEYLGNGLSWDLASHLAVAAAIALVLLRRSRPGALLMSGVVLYYGYVLCGAAAATHMSGRFFALPVFISLLVLARVLPGVRSGALVAACALLALLLNPHSPLRMGTSAYADVEQDLDQIDTNWFVHREGAALIDFFERPSLPDHAWFHAGMAFRERPEVVSIGAEGGAAIGYFGYAAGPGKLIVDYAGLSDPLLARLPACNTKPAGSWRSGHFFRSIPAGYVASMETGENRIEEPGLHAYYEKVRSLTRGPLFRAARLRDILFMNLGLYEDLKSEYVRSAAGSCRIPTRKRERSPAPGQ